jgi:hypothetical protein
VVPTETPTYAGAFTVADRTAAWGQLIHLRLTRLELSLLVVGAATGFIDLPVGSRQIDLGGVIAAAVFTVSLALRAYRLTVRPTQTWQDGRAAAESIKTLCWRYAVGSRVFPADMSAADADRVFVTRLREILDGIRDVSDIRAAVPAGVQITPWMQQLRAASLDDRRACYERARIADQQAWYAGRAEFNSRQMHRWGAIVLVFEVFGAIAGAMEALGVLDLDWSTGDLVGVAATLAAAMTAWAQTRQYSTLASAYRIAYEELSAIRALVPHVRTEAEWEEFVDSAEAAISREHTMWRASRT